MEKSILRTIEEEEFVFDYRRVIYWPRCKILIAADLHWGKTQYLRHHGIAVPEKVFEDDLNRLSSLLEDYKTDTILVLGDLIHHEKSLNAELVEKVSWFRHHFPVELILVKGNHDRFTRFPESWGIVEENDFKLANFYFSHDFNKKISDFQFSGHVHPMMRLAAGFDQVRLPAFILSQNCCLLPAFGQLTGGRDLRLQKGQESLLILPGGISAHSQYQE